MARYTDVVVLDGEKISEDLRKLGIEKTQFASSAQISMSTLRSAINGGDVSVQTAEKIARALFKPLGYYNADRKDPPKTNIDISDIVTLLEDIKQEQADTIKAIKTLTTIAARMLAIWEGERHENNNEKGSDPASH